MESTSRPFGLESAPHWRWTVVATIALLVVSLVMAPLMEAQESTESPETPDVVLPGTGDDNGDESGDGTPETTPEETEEATAEAEEDPEEDQPASSGTVIQIAATDTGNPAVIAHGLAFLTGDRTVWQVREVEPDSASDAEAVIANASFVYQVEGTSVVRNDVTGKRALLDPGEGYFKAGGDAYTTLADSSDSLIWVFEVVDPNEVEDDAFYESPLIEDYAEGVFDQVLIRYVLQPGESATLPDHTGPALVMSANGDIDIESGGLGLLGTGDGQLITEDATVSNNSSDPVEFLLVAFGSEVGDESASTDTGSPAATEAADTTDAADDTTDETTEPETTDDTTGETTEPETTDDGAGGTETSINITAEAELYVVVVADGVTVFDGPIPAGGESGVIVGTSFEVYTSYGAGTLFTNSCGESFYMGFEEGEAQYVLTASSESCAP